MNWNRYSHEESLMTLIVQCMLFNLASNINKQRNNTNETEIKLFHTVRAYYEESNHLKIWKYLRQTARLQSSHFSLVDSKQASKPPVPQTMPQMPKCSFDISRRRGSGQCPGILWTGKPKLEPTPLQPLFPWSQLLCNHCLPWLAKTNLYNNFLNILHQRK